MNSYDVSLNGARLAALGSGALHWPAERLLVVSDLHFGKSARIARRGGPLLPPFETTETLARLEADIEICAATTVICLGDSFDDLSAVDSLSEAEAIRLTRLMAGRRWVWISGNHDPAPFGLGGSHLAQVQHRGLTFRHIAQPARNAEVSGHYHPKARVAGQSRPCFLIDDTRVILPAYGTYTGGLPCHAPVLTDLMRPEAIALMTGRRLYPIPMPRR